MTASEYQLYLRDPHWKLFRKWILKQRGGACEECGISNVWACIAYGQPLNVHHLPSGYDHLGQERPQDVVVLCRHCHEEKHGTPVLPDVSSLFWKFCRAIKECPEHAWSLMKAVDELPRTNNGQMLLPLVSSA